MRLTLGTSRDLVKELPRLGVMTVGFLATLAFEHFVVHELIVLPAVLETGAAALWTVAAMVVPELVVLFAVGYSYRLRSALAVVMHAGVAALLRGGFHLALALSGRPGHTDPHLLSASELTVTTPAMALAYLLVLALAAAAAAADQRQLVGDR